MLGDRIRRLRRERGVSLHRLAEAAEYDRGDLSKLERGLVARLPRIERLDKLAAALGTSAFRLLGG